MNLSGEIRYGEWIKSWSAFNEYFINSVIIIKVYFSLHYLYKDNNNDKEKFQDKVGD